MDEGWATRAKRLPWAAIAVGGCLFLLLAAFVTADPANGATFSSSPFSDEGFNTVNARNFVQLGRWSTDEWNLYLVNLPYSLLSVVAMKLLGTGIVAIRLVSIACVSATALALAWGLRRSLGTAWAAFAGLAFAGSGLVLYYGRLAYVEDLVVLGLTLGALVVASSGRVTFRWGLVAGACFAVAIGAKPSAIFAVAGIWLALVAAWGWRDGAMRRWLGGCAAAIVAFGVGWLLIVWLPNRDAVSMDIRIWAPVQLSLTPLGMARSLSSYVRGGSDGVIGWMLGPLLALGFAGLLSIVALRKRLDADQARLAVAAAGWVVLGIGVVVIASYRPNRYALPMAPGLAILAAIGLRLLAGRLAELRGGVRLPVFRSIGTALAAVAIVVAVAPGLTRYYAWNQHATSELPAIQDRMANLVPEGELVAGRESGLFLMESKATTLEVQLTQQGTAANAGDLYARGVRWYVEPDTSAAPPGVPADVWGRRQSLACGRWGGMTECLYRLP